MNWRSTGSTGCSIACIKTLVKILSRQRGGLKFCHINAQSLKPKIDECRNIFAESEIDIICVSETWFLPCMNDDLFSIKGYRLFRADREEHAGGVAIYVRDSIKCKLLLKSGQDSSVEFLFIEIIGVSGNLLVSCVYRRNRSVSLSQYFNTLGDISVAYNDIVIGGDFNCNILKDNSLTNDMIELGLSPTNIYTPTHFYQ